MRKLFFLVLLGSCGLCFANATTADGPNDNEEIARLIAELGSDSFAERDAATKALAKIGEPALRLLRQAATSPDSEINHRAGDLIARIEARIETERLLQPKKIRLAYDGVPLAEAVADFARQSGYPITLHRDPAKYASRKITLDTGLTTFWQAFHQFRDKAGVQEILAPANPGEDAQGAKQVINLNNGGGNNIVINGNNIIINGNGVPAEQGPPAPRPLVLGDGTASSVPTYLAGSVRVRAVPAPGKAEAGQIEIMLEVDAEARLQGFTVVDLHFIDKAVDDQGQTLTMMPVPPPPANPPNMGNPNVVNIVFNGNAVVVNGQKFNMDGSAGNSQNKRSVPVRLKPGEKPAKSLRELSGTLTLGALKDIEPLVTVDNILKAAGKTVKGKGGRAIQVQSVEKLGNGDLKIQAALEIPGQNAMPNNPFGGNIVINGMNLNGQSASPADYPKLIDAKGKVYAPATASPRNNGQLSEVTFTYRPEGAPVQLVLFGRQTVNFAVPFILKNVPLP